MIIPSITLLCKIPKNVQNRKPTIGFGKPHRTSKNGTYSGLIGLLLNKKLIENKTFYRPTDPLFFWHVTGNTGIFLWPNDSP